MNENPIERTKLAIVEQTGSEVTPVSWNVSFVDADPQLAAVENWGMLDIRSFNPDGNNDPAKPYGILVNLGPDLYGVPYITKRWVKVALRGNEDEFYTTMRRSVDAQRAFLRQAGFPDRDTENMHYMTEILIDGYNFPATVSTHFGRSIHAILKNARRNHLPEDAIMNFAANAMQQAAIQAVELYRAGVPTGESGKRSHRHYYQDDPNLGNILMRLMPAAYGGMVRAVNYDLTNRKSISTWSWQQEVEQDMFRKYGKWAQTGNIAFPDSVDALLERKTEIDTVLAETGRILNMLVVEGMY